MKIHIETRHGKLDIEREPMERYQFCMMWAMICIMTAVISIAAAIIFC